MDALELLIDLHGSQVRQGPGSDASTLNALRMSGLMDRPHLKVADLGCGTGAATLVLAQHLRQPEIVALDLMAPFLELLRQRAEQAGVRESMQVVQGDMAAPPVAPGTLDLIWSEGAIYHLGFAKGVALWAPLLKPGGVMVLSELTWLQNARPKELQDYWDAAYTEVDTAAAKIAILESLGLTLIGYQVLPEADWLEHYYAPLEASFEAFLARHNHAPEAQACVAESRAEMALYRRYKDHMSYGMYVVRKPDGA